MGEMLKPIIHDFRSGKQGWGHALHSSTWRPEPERWSGRPLWRRKLPDRVSVMVHCSRFPNEGDTLLYSAKSGTDRAATIVEVRPCWDPRDMFTLVLEEAALPSKEANPHG